MNKEMQTKGRFDSIIVNGKIVNLITKEIYESQIALKDQAIYAIDDNLMNFKNDNTEIIDANGSFIVPGFIDQHIHLHHTQLNIVEFSKIALKRGTTAIATDLYGEGVVGGIKAIRNIIDIAKELPIKIFYLLPIPGYIQNGKFGHNGNLNIDEMNIMLKWHECVGSSDTFATEILNDNDEFIKLCKRIQKLGKKVSGHGSELSNIQINDWARKIRETDDHECVDDQEMLYKLRRGIGISMRLASGSEDLINLIKLLNKYPEIDKRKITLNSDVISAADLYEKGCIDRAIRIMIESGISVLDAYQMATINTAENLKIDSFYGSITPGRLADLLFITDLDKVTINDVISNGKIVIKNGDFIKEYPKIEFPDNFFNTVKITPAFDIDKLKILYTKKSKAKVRIILVDGQSYITQEIFDVLNVKDDVIQCDTNKDILYVSAIDRVMGSDKIANALIKGFGLKKGAFALTKNSHQQSLLVAGTNHEDMFTAVKALEKIGGGNIVVCDGKVIKSLPLELFGLESSNDIENVVQMRKEIELAMVELGCNLPSPFETLSFVALPVTIGNLKICQEGLVDVWKNKHVDVVVE